MPLQCAYHPDREPVGACVECGRLICVECKALLGGRIYCTPCADKKFVSKESSPAATTAAPVSSPSSARQAETVSSAPTQVYQSTTAPAAAATNIYIQQSAPATASSANDHLKGWNWGAFVFSWIWGIVNHVWIAFLVFVPVIDIIWVFVLGAKGNEWAWKAKQWESVEAFKNHQKKWKPWAVLLFILSIVGFVIYLGVMLFMIFSVGMGNFEIGF